MSGADCNADPAFLKPCLSSETNWLAGEASGSTVNSALGRFELLHPIDGAVTILVRPEQISLQPDPTGQWLVQQVRYFGHDQLVTVTAAHHPALRARVPPQLKLPPGMPVDLAITGPVNAYHGQA